jgi:hypothetical protein
MVRVTHCIHYETKAHMYQDNSVSDDIYSRLLGHIILGGCVDSDTSAHASFSWRPSTSSPQSHCIVNCRLRLYFRDFNSKSIIWNSYKLYVLEKHLLDVMRTSISHLYLALAIHAGLSIEESRWAKLL